MSLMIPGGLRRLLDGLHVVGLARGQAGLEQLAGEADDPVERVRSSWDMLARNRT